MGVSAPVVGGVDDVYSHSPDVSGGGSGGGGSGGYGAAGALARFLKHTVTTLSY